MASGYDILMASVSILASVSISIIAKSISLCQYCNTNYPQLTQTVSAIIGIYISYRFTKRVIKSWINMVVLMIKLWLLLMAVILALAVYLRGEKFFSQDIPYFQASMEHYDGGSIRQFVSEKVHQLAFNSFVNQFNEQPSKKRPNKSKKRSDKGKKFQKKAKKVMNEYGIEVDDGFLDYMNENEGFDVQGALNGLGIDVDQVNQFFDRFV